MEYVPILPKSSAKLIPESISTLRAHPCRVNTFYGTFEPQTARGRLTRDPLESGPVSRSSHLLAGVEPDVFQQHDVAVGHRCNALFDRGPDAVVHLDHLQQGRQRQQVSNNIRLVSAGVGYNKWRVSYTAAVCSTWRTTADALRCARLESTTKIHVGVGKNTTSAVNVGRVPQLATRDSVGGQHRTAVTLKISIAYNASRIPASLSLNTVRKYRSDTVRTM